MQMMKSTFDGMKRNGQLPPEADFSNPNHTLRAGQIHAAYLFDLYGGDAFKAAAAYYGGEKAVTSDGRVQNFGNKQRPQDPTTHQYAEQIVRRMQPS